jgi:trehalose/maltose transport system permease protein
MDTSLSTERNQTPLIVALISGLFILLGIGALAWLGLSIYNDPTIAAAQSAEGSSNGSVILSFLDTYGIILPVLVIAIGLYLIFLGIRINARRITAAVWGKQVLLWLLILDAYLLAQTLGNELSAPGTYQNFLPALLLLIGIGIAGLASLQWLNANETAFIGSETLSSRSSRIAWNLLIPTIVILIIVAARPLEQTFIASLTDERFASNQPVNFVGFDNYAQLLGVRIDVLPQCVAGQTIAGCPEVLETDETGAPITTFPRARNYLDQSYSDLRFREVSIITLPNSQVVLSARDRDFIQAIGNTLYFTLFSVSLELLLGLFIALVINSKFPGRGLMRAAMLVPWAIPTVVSARLWEIMLRDNTSGVINSALVNVGLLERPLAWLTNNDTQIIALILVDVWKTTPFMALILLAGLQIIPSDIYEAADVDGASKVRQFFSITLPLLRPTIAIALVFRTLDAIRVFDVFQVLLERRALSMATYNYETLVQSQQFGYASAIGVTIFIIILVFTVIYVRALGVNTE